MLLERAVGELTHDDLDDALPLLLGQRPELAHGAGAENAVDRQRIGQVAHVAPEAGLVEPDPSLEICQQVTGRLA